MKIIQAYRFALDPTQEQERALRSHAGAARFAWNWGLSKCKARYAAEKKWYSAFELQKLWNVEKKADPALAWWPENSKCVYQQAFQNLDRALHDFIKSKKGQRKGQRLGFPRYKKRGRARDSFRLGGTLRCERNTVTLPRLGIIRTHELADKLGSLVGDDAARIRSATVSRTAQRWFVSFSVEVDRDIPARHARAGTAVGIDVGIKTQVTAVDNAGRVMVFPGPKPLAASLRRLRHASRAHSRKRTGSANRRQSAARIARIHARIANVRMDAAHKATSLLARRYETIIVEDLNVAGLTRNHRIARAITDQGLGQAHRLLAYKSVWNGGQLVTADRWYPSSKTCSACGAVKAKLPLSERTYRCDDCDLVMDRDENAARNLLQLAASGAESQNAREGAVRPRPARHAPSNLEPGIPKRVNTRTAARQRAAVA